MDALTLHAGGTLSVVGESYRQDALEEVARTATGPEPYDAELKGRARAVAREKGRLWFQAALLREPDNAWDENAIAVHASGVGLVGYLDRETAIDYAPVFEELARQGCAVGACPAVLTGGGEKAFWGVVLCLSSPEAITPICAHHPTRVGRGEGDSKRPPSPRLASFQLEHLGDTRALAYKVEEATGATRSPGDRPGRGREDGLPPLLERRT